MDFKRKLKQYLKLIRDNSVNVLIVKIFKKIFGSFTENLRYKKAIEQGTGLVNSDFFKKLGLKLTGSPQEKVARNIRDNVFLSSIVNNKDKGFIISNLSLDQKKEIINSAEDICNHVFDLLGSSRIKVSYRMKPRGLEGYLYNSGVNDYWLKKIKGQINDKAVNLLHLKEKENFYGKNKINYDPIDWHIDFKSGYRWKKDIWYKKIEYGNVNGADVKVPWELSRLQHLIILGQAYLLTGDEKYCMEYVYQVVDWIENNSPQFGVNWKCTMDVAIRAANLIFSLAFFKDSGFITDEFLFYIAGTIYIHGEHIINNLEFGSLTSNHYLSDISGLIFIAGLFSDFRIGQRWKKFASSELINEMKKQVYEDGTDFESSTCYHRLVLELFLFPAIYISKLSDKFNGSNYYETCRVIFGEKFVSKLYRMFDFILHSLKPNGFITQIGDNDNGRLLVFNKREVLDMSYLLALGAIFFRESRFRIKEFNFPPEVFWIYGYKGRSDYKRLKENSIRNLNSRAFHNSGWYIMRKDNNFLMASCGPNGQNGNGGHAHNDKLSFELHSSGEDIIIDPGTYIYTSLPEWRNLFRSTASHNTVLIDNQEQNRFEKQNLFTLKDDARVVVRNWKTTEGYDYLEAEHYGYDRLENPAKHKRRIIFDKKELLWIIKDELNGSGKHAFDVSFHLNPGLTGEIDRSSLVTGVIKRGKIILWIIPFEKDDLSVTIEKDWFSKGYGSRIQSSVLRYSKNVKVPAEFLFILSAKKNNYSIAYITRMMEIISDSYKRI